MEGTGDELPDGADDRRIAIVKPTVSNPFFSMRKVDGNVGGVVGSSAIEYPATTFECNVSHGGDPEIAEGHGWRNIEVDTLRIKAEARERHVIFKADECSN